MRRQFTPPVSLPLRLGGTFPPESRMSPKPRQVILVGNQQVSLPEGVTALDWSLERVNYQNPRIRSFLGCIRLIEGVLESNYALLHCSPERLLDIWSKVRKVARPDPHPARPAAGGPSRIPRLEEARQSAQMALGMLDTTSCAGSTAFRTTCRRSRSWRSASSSASRSARSTPSCTTRSARSWPPIRGACTTRTTSSRAASPATSRRRSGSMPP